MAKNVAALELISPPKRSSESEYQRFRYFCIVGRSMSAELPHVVDVRDAVLLHQRGGAIDDAQDAGLADEHVVRFFRQHEARRARERVERALGEGEELEFAVAVGEEREHEEREPVGARLVERAEDARLVLVAAPALEERLGLFAPVAAEVRLEEVDHRPEVAPLFDVHLEEVAKVVDARARVAEHPLLLDARRLGVPLGDDEAAEGVSVLARDLLPDRLAEVVAEADRAIGDGVGEEDAPAVVGHLHVVEVRPAVGLDADRRAQEDVVRLEARRPHLLPPADEVRLPGLERALELLVVGEAGRCSGCARC